MIHVVGGTYRTRELDCHSSYSVKAQEEAVEFAEYRFYFFNYLQ